MKTKTASWAAAIAALVWASSLHAHHSFSLFEVSMPIWLKGTVVSYGADQPACHV